MTINASGGAPVLGTLRAADGNGVVRMDNGFDASIEDVWSALTDPRRLALWLGEVEGDLRPGGEFRARFFASGWEGTGRIDSCERPRRLLVWTKDAEQPDERPIEVTLTDDGDQIRLVWEERGMPLNLIAAYGAGIQIHVEDLADHVAGHERRDPQPRFDALFPAYQALSEDRT
jgi:uncharacterized protein YndB with AHSA1/START domain